MKINKLMLTAAIAGMVSASALATDIYITGATAFRGTVYSVLNNPANATWTSYVEASGTGSSANQRTWSGTFLGQPWNVYESYSGSVEGQETLLGIRGQNLFLTIGNASSTFPHDSDMAFSDVTQETVGYSGLANIGPVAVQPFALYPNPNAVAKGIQNVSAKALYQMLSSANVRVSLLNGNNANTAATDLVWLVGRNYLSGTRTTVHMDTDYVVVPCNLAYDNLRTGAGETGNGTATWKKVSSNKSSVAAQDPGYSSGGNLAKALGIDGSHQTHPAAIGYLSPGDAILKNSGGTVIGTLTPIKYDGVDYSVDKVANGQYHLWTYENLYTLAAGNANASSFWNALKTPLDNALLTSTTAVPLSKMRVTRDSDGSPVY